MRKRYFLPYVMVLKKLNWIELNQINTRNSHSIILKHLTFTFSWVLVVVLFKWIKAKKWNLKWRKSSSQGSVTLFHCTECCCVMTSFLYTMYCDIVVLGYLWSPRLSVRLNEFTSDLKNNLHFFKIKKDINIIYLYYICRNAAKVVNILQ